MKRDSIFDMIINAIVFGLIFLLGSCKTANQDFNTDKAWENADNIIANIVVPTFPDRVFDIMDYGGNADGVTDNTEAFKKAIAACNESGGGKVLVPEGKYLTGPIHLKSNVNLHLVKNAEVLFTKD